MTDFIHSDSSSNSMMIITREFVIPCVNGKIAMGHLIVMGKNSAYIWISHTESTAKSMKNLVLSMPVKYESMPIATNLFVEEEDENTQAMAIRLTRKHKIPLFISSNLGLNFLENHYEIEKAISKLLSQELE